MLRITGFFVFVAVLLSNAVGAQTTGTSNPADHIIGRFTQTAPATSDPAIGVPDVDVQVEGTDTVLFKALHGDWRGRLELGHDDKPDRLILTRRPAAREINREIPTWARDAVAGKLEWQLELDVKESAADGLTLEGSWYPGEVTWTETSDPAVRAVEIIGRGDPVRVVYVHQKIGWAPVVDAAVRP